MKVKKRKPMERDYAKFCDMVLKYTFPEIRPYTNADCIKCHCTEKHMFKVGAIIFCKKCFREEFKTETPVTNERLTYLKWLKKYNA